MTFEEILDQAAAMLPDLVTELSSGHLMTRKGSASSN